MIWWLRIVGVLLWLAFGWAVWPLPDVRAVLAHVAVLGAIAFFVLAETD